MSLFQHIYRSIRYGEWSIGFHTKKNWPGKPYFGFYSSYYDGHHWCLHLWTFYLGASFY